MDVYRRISFVSVSRSIGESCSSLGASSLKNFSAVGSCHSLSETVLHLSLSLLGLVGSFHEWHLLCSFRWGLRGFVESSRIHIKTSCIIYKRTRFVKSFCKKSGKKFATIFNSEKNPYLCRPIFYGLGLHKLTQVLTN